MSGRSCVLIQNLTSYMLDEFSDYMYYLPYPEKSFRNNMHLAIYMYMYLLFLCRLRSIATHRDHFVRRLSVCLSVRLCPSVSVRPSVCLSVCHTRIAMFRRRHMHSSECCLYLCVPWPERFREASSNHIVCQSICGAWLLLAPHAFCGNSSLCSNFNKITNQSCAASFYYIQNVSQLSIMIFSLSLIWRWETCIPIMKDSFNY